MVIFHSYVKLPEGMLDITYITIEVYAFQTYTLHMVYNVGN